MPAEDLALRKQLEQKLVLKGGYEVSLESLQNQAVGFWLPGACPHLLLIYQ